MAEVNVSIGGRDFEVVCGEGQEGFLRAAAQMLDAEATKLSQGSDVRLTENRMLLMAGLMLADRTAAMEDQLRAKDNGVDYQQLMSDAEAKITSTEAELVQLKAQAQQLQDDLAKSKSDAAHAVEEAQRERNVAKAESERLMAERETLVQQKNDSEAALAAIVKDLESAAG